MKPRSALSASEVEGLWAKLERQLDHHGLPTQPEVAGRVLALVSDPCSGLRDYAGVIKTDAPLSGRLLRFANSAFFAQRQPVTNLERACVLLGIDRLKAISLGFFLSRAAASDPAHTISRKVWGESVYRACLASELAKELTPAYAAEAFVVGLMLDAGIPLSLKMIGQPYAELYERSENPGALFDAEFATLPFTHVDVLAALCRRWRLPELLVRPLTRHHTPPRGTGRENVVQTLHRIAFYTGAIKLNFPEAKAPEPVASAPETILGLDGNRLQNAIERATTEYTAMHEVFREVAETIGGLTDMALRVHQQLVSITDEVILEQLRKPTTNTGSFTIGGRRVDIEVDAGGRAVAYLSDGSGSRLLSYNFRPGEDDAISVLEGLGLEAGPCPETHDIDMYLRSMAA
jgi:HD-like signal output (HDOD) protein